MLILIIILIFIKDYRGRQIVSQNIIANPISASNAHLVFEISGSDWYISNVSLKNAQETSFSPDEFTIVQDVSKNVASETFDFRFEIYDINNNFIPVLVDESKTFNGGNIQRIQKGLVFTPRSLQFQFDSGSQPVPPTVVGFTVTKNLLTGSVTYTSQSFDFDGNQISDTSNWRKKSYPQLPLIEDFKKIDEI